MFVKLFGWKQFFVVNFSVCQSNWKSFRSIILLLWAICVCVLSYMLHHLFDCANWTLHIDRCRELSGATYSWWRCCRTMCVCLISTFIDVSISNDMMSRGSENAANFRIDSIACIRYATISFNGLRSDGLHIPYVHKCQNAIKIANVREAARGEYSMYSEEKSPFESNCVIHLICSMSHASLPMNDILSNWMHSNLLAMLPVCFWLGI